MCYMISDLRKLCSRKGRDITAMDKGTVKLAAAALLKHVKNVAASQKESLLEEAHVVSMIVGLKKIPDQIKVKAKRIDIPHALHDADEINICLFVKEDARDNLKEALSNEPILGLSKVIGLQKLRKKYSRYEDRRKLCAEFDMFMCDDRILPLMPKALGKTFFEKKKHPIPVKVTGKTVHKCITKARDSTYFYLGWGQCSAVRVANTTMSVDEIVENILAAVDNVKEYVPQKLKGIQAIHIKTFDSIALPIYNSLNRGLKIDMNVAPVGSSGKNKRSTPSGDGETAPKRSKTSSKDEPVAPAAVELKAGVMMLAERKNNWEPAQLIRLSTKQEGAWAVKFESDGKVFTRAESQLKPAEQDEFDSDAELEYEEDEEDDDE